MPAVMLYFQESQISIYSDLCGRKIIVIRSYVSLQCQYLSSHWLELAVFFFKMSNSGLACSILIGPLYADMRRPVGLLEYSDAAQWGEHGAIHGALPQRVDQPHGRRRRQRRPAGVWRLVVGKMGKPISVICFHQVKSIWRLLIFKFHYQQLLVTCLFSLISAILIFSLVYF